MNVNEVRTIENAIDGFKNKSFTVRQLVEFYLKNIKEKNPELNAYLEVFDDCLEQADLADKMHELGTARSMEGVPMAIKDCILIKGRKVSSGSKMLENYVAPYDATAIKLLREQGAIFLGRTNMDEFAMGGSGENSAYGPTKNPINQNHVPGGTSSGSAAAVAANMCLLALGSDTGGSVRQPGSFCGVYGFKPSYGGVSRSGLIAAGSSLDQIGVLARSVEDVEKIYGVIGKEDILDGTSIPEAVRSKRAEKDFTKTICYPEKYLEAKGISEEVKSNFFNFLEEAKVKGYTVNPTNIDSLQYALAMYYIIMPAEVSTNLSRLEGLRFGGGDVGEHKDYAEFYQKTRGKFFGKEAKRRIIIGSYVLSHGYYDAYYGKALALRQKMKAEFEKVFSENSIFLTPTAPTTAFKLASAGEIRDPSTLYLEDIFTVPANLAELPGMSIPNGFDSSGLPFGIQALAGFGREKDIFEFAADFAKTS